jgi:hypothetical protein
MGAAIVLWLVAAAGGYFVWSAQRSGQMRIFRTRFIPEDNGPPQLLLREDDPKAFHDALLIRWTGVGLFVVVGAGCAIAEWLGISN